MTRQSLSVVLLLAIAPLVASPLRAQAGGAPAGRAAEGASAAPIASVTLPPALDRVLRDYEREWGAGNASALAALFTEDGFVLQSGKMPVRGRAAIRTAYASNPGSPLKLRALAFATADSVGYIIGGYRYGEAPGDMGKFTLTLRRGSDGRWLIASDMDNGNAMPRRPGSL